MKQCYRNIRSLSNNDDFHLSGKYSDCYLLHWWTYNWSCSGDYIILASLVCCVGRCNGFSDPYSEWQIPTEILTFSAIICNNHSTNLLRLSHIVLVLQCCRLSAMQVIFQQFTAVTKPVMSWKSWTRASFVCCTPSKVCIVFPPLIFPVTGKVLYCPSAQGNLCLHFKSFHASVLWHLPLQLV